MLAVHIIFPHLDPGNHGFIHILIIQSRILKLRNLFSSIATFLFWDHTRHLIKQLGEKIKYTCCTDGVLNLNIVYSL